MYSQNDEEKHIEAYFRDKPIGKFLDIGAYDGKTFSNTLKLAEMGWSGVSVEPDANAFVALKQNFKNNHNIVLVNAVFADHNGIVKFHSCGGDMISTTNDQHKAKWLHSYSTIPYRETYCSTVTVNDIIKHFGSKFDFINLDVEGTNIDILKTLPLKSLNTQMICIEHDNKTAEAITYCSMHGLNKQLYRNNENIIMCK